MSLHPITSGHSTNLDGTGHGTDLAHSILHPARSTSSRNTLLPSEATEPEDPANSDSSIVASVAGDARNDHACSSEVDTDCTVDHSSCPGNSSPIPSRRFKRLTPYGSHYLFTALVVTFQTVAIAGAVAIPFTLLLNVVAKSLGYEVRPNLQVTLVIFGGLAGSLVVLHRGHAMRTLGIRRLDMRPRLWKRCLWMPSIAHQLKQLRIFSAVCIALPLISLVTHNYLLYGTSEAVDARTSLPFLFGWLAFMLGGVTIYASAVSCLRDFRSRAIRNSLRFHHRGVALRSFIAEFDSSLRSIYESCSLSRRISLAHRTVFTTSVAAFSLAGCLAAYIQSDAYLGEMLSAVSVIGILVILPTKSRLVKWCSELLDPFCKPSEEEYEIYS